jgi:O-antigen ligase
LPSRIESVAAGTVDIPATRGFRHTFLTGVAFSWGFCAYFPIGVMYLNVLLMLTAFAVWPGLTPAMRRLGQQPVMLPLTLFVGWTLVATFAGDWFPDTGTRLFHTFRVALVLCMGMMLTPKRARIAFLGFLAGSIVAAMIVAMHHVWGMPDWELWASLLTTRNNFSSGNMITMATAAGACLVVGLGHGVGRSTRWLLLALFLALALTVALHAVSRNSQLLLAGLMLVALLYRFRSIKAGVGGLVAVALLALMTWQFSPTTSKRFVEMASDLHAVTTAHNYSTSVGVRWRMYQEAVQGIGEHPVLGTGLGSWLPRWRGVWHELGDSQPSERNALFAEINNPHNDFLLTGMEIGMPGMLLLVWLLGAFFWSGWRSRSTLGGVTAIFAASIVGTAMVNAPLRDAALGMTLLWLMGASVALRGEPSNA